MQLSPSAMLTAVLFAAGEPLSRKRLAELVGVSPELLEQGLTRLREDLAGSGLALVENREEVELRTAPEAADLVRKLRESELSRDLGKAGLETLAIILYKDGATRGEVDWIRGVNSTAAIRSLLIRGLIVRIENVEDRRKARYIATIDALSHLGISQHSELPRFEELSKELSASLTRAEATPAS